MFTIIHLCDEFVLINKRANVSFHKGTGPKALTEEIRTAIGSRELYPIHRLDTMTSGLLLFGRTRKATAELAEQFRHKKIEKFYLAIGGNSPKKKQGLIIGDMERGRRGAWILTTECKRPAVTRFFSTSLQPGLRLYLVKPYTGRTHQIRVALRAVSAPILGDPIYGRRLLPEGVNVDRGYLHAYAIGFKLGGVSYRYLHQPDEGSFFTSPEFKVALERVGVDPWELKWPDAPEGKSAQAAPTPIQSGKAPARHRAAGRHGRKPGASGYKAGRSEERRSEE